jgi:hypothetical protein
MAACVLANADVSTVAMSDLAKTIMNDFQSSASIESVDGASLLTPRMVSIGPNPLAKDGKVEIRLTVPRDARVWLQAFDVGGRLVSTLADRMYAAGKYDVTWSPTNDGLAQGVYFIRLTSPGAASFQRIVIAQ